MMPASETPKPIRRWIPYALSLLAIGAMLWYLDRSALLRELDFRTLRWNYIAPVFLAEATAFALTGQMLAVFVAQAGVSLKFVEWYGLMVASNVSNIIVPVSGGMIARAGYLKLRYGFPVSRFSALLAASYLIIFLVSGLTGLLILAALWLSGQQGGQWLAGGLLAVMAAAPVILILIPLERLPIPQEGGIMRRVHSALEGWRQIRTDPLLLTKQIIIVALLELTQATSLYFSLRTLGRPIPFANVLLIGVLTNLTNFVRITPGALGVRETVAGVSAQLVGFSAAEGVAAALVSRAAQWIVSFTLGPIFMFILARYAQQRVDTPPDSQEALAETEHQPL